MQLGRTQQVIALMIIWAGALVGVDKTLNHAPAPIDSTPGHGKPQIVVTFTHFCCTGCYDKMFSAAKSMSWIVTATTDRSTLVKQEDLKMARVDEAAHIETQYQKDATLLLDESDLKSVDLVRVNRQFRDAGLLPKRLVLENVAHFRLIAVDPHLCCGLCEGAAKSSLKLEQSLERAQAKIDNPALDDRTIETQIMPYIEVDVTKQRIVAEYYQTADVTGFLQAIQRAGFSPKEVRIEMLDEGGRG